MASDTNTKSTELAQKQSKERWFRLAPARSSEIDHIMDLYWGGKERRITGITMRIIAVNALALIILMFGILYLGQYQNNLINARLETVDRELDLVSAALSEKMSEENDITQISNVTFNLAKALGQHIEIYNNENQKILDTRDHPSAQEIRRKNNTDKVELQSIKMLKSAGRFLLSLLPETRELPKYPADMKGYIDVPDALQGASAISVWQNKEEKIFLSAAAPILANSNVAGALLITREATEIEEDFVKVWADILKIFAVTLVLTILLSIYLSGVIAQPLKKLAKATEAVRRGQAQAEDIPDMSARHDEIGELSVALRQMTMALWERMDATERFAADVSHELKNPLTSLRSAIETLGVVKKAEDRKKLMKIINHDVERLDRLITDISNASRIDAELSKEAFQKINLKHMLHNILDMYATDPLQRQAEKSRAWNKTIKTKDAQLTLNANGENPIHIWGIESRLSQVLQNLIANAWSFTPKNGEISIHVEAFKNQVRIRVEDQGPGIPNNKLETVFERFYSERPQSEEYGRHSGLGLSICRQIIEAHGGQIYAENIKNSGDLAAGARFNVVLNIA